MGCVKHVLNLDQVDYIASYLAKEIAHNQTYLYYYYESIRSSQHLLELTINIRILIVIRDWIS